MLHSKHFKKHPQYASRPIVSVFTRDDLQRVTSVRHTRDDSVLGGYLPRLLGRFDTAYDENSMMRYEARWYEQDDNGTSVTPDATDFYFYRSDNKLDKAIYHVTRDDNDDPLDLTGFSYALIDSNDSTHSDRVIYSRRNIGTRDRICCEAVLRNKAVLRTLVSRQRRPRRRITKPAMVPEGHAPQVKRSFAEELDLRQQPSFASRCAAQARSLREPFRRTEQDSSATTTATSCARCGANPTATAKVW